MHRNRRIAITLFLTVALLTLITGTRVRAQQCEPTDRTFNFINNCEVDIWVGAVGNLDPDQKKCTTNLRCPANEFCTPIVSRTGMSCMDDTQCSPGEFCDTSTSTGVCAFRQCTFVPVNGTVIQTSTACTTNSQCSADQFCDTSTGVCAVVPADGNGWKLDAKGGVNSSNTVCVPTPWGGRFWARTGCSQRGDQFLCDTGQCLGNENKFSLYCALSGVPPTTLAEFTMPPFGDADFYDVSMVDSANLALEIVPDSSTYDMLTNGGISTTSCTDDAACSGLGFNWKCDTQLRQCVDIFRCGSPGCVDDCEAIGLLDRSFLPACTWDSTGPVVISKFAISEASCSTPLRVTNSQGEYVGCLAPQVACDANPPGLDCSVSARDLYGCTGNNAGSCFTEGATQNCCGCPNWAPQGTCQNSNTEWVSVAEPFAAAFNDACPTAYAFPFDDLIKTFTCFGVSEQQNVGYTITFCPARLLGGPPAPLPPLVLELKGKASRVGSDNAKVKISGKFAFTDTLDLGAATLTIESLLKQAGIQPSTELVKGTIGTELLPLTLEAHRGGKVDRAIFKGPSGQRPSIQATVKIHNGMLEAKITVRRATIPEPSLCSGVPPSTDLVTRFRLDDGMNSPVVIATVQPWECRTDRDGDIRKLRLK